MIRPLPRIAAFGLLAACGAALCQPTADLTGRESVAHIQHQGGFATVGTSGEDGSRVPVTEMQPATLGLEGQHDHEGTYLSWEVAYGHQWALTQTWSMDAAASRFSASGSMTLASGGTVFGPGCTPCTPSLLLAGINAQAIDFTLDEATRYEFRSQATPTQWVDLLVWSDVADAWLYVWAGFVVNEGQAWESSGVLEAGLYRLRNNRDDMRIGSSQPLHASSWAWSMTLPDATVSAVPEPAVAWLLTGGLLLIGARRLRRPPVTRPGG
jgi:hypothetical protein